MALHAAVEDERCDVTRKSHRAGGWQRHLASVRSQAPDPKSQAPNPKSQTPDPKSQIANPQIANPRDGGKVAHLSSRETTENMRRYLALLCALLLATAGVAAAQGTNAALSGTVTDEQGGVLPGVTVTVRNVD